MIFTEIPRNLLLQSAVFTGHKTAGYTLFILLKNRNGGKTPIFLISVGPGICPVLAAELLGSRGGRPRALLAPDVKPGKMTGFPQVLC